MSKSPFRFIGKHRRAVEHKRFVLGQGHFAADIQLQGMLHIALVASPYASAKINPSMSAKPWPCRVCMRS